MTDLAEVPPAEVAEALRAELAPAALRVSDGAKKPVLDVWLRKALPAEAAHKELDVMLKSVKEGTLVAAIRVHAAGADYRDQSYKPGLYTARYAFRPADGDHQGTSETRDFLVLSPAADDTTPDVVAREELIKRSTKVSGKKHPAVLYLARPTSKEAVKLTENDLGHKLLECAVPAAKGDPVRVAIVVQGHAAE